MAETVFLDACVLYPDALRKLVLDAADAGLLRPAYSPRVLEEWRIAAARKGMAAEDVAREAADAMRRVYPEGEVAPDPALGREIDLPDPADRHVLAATVAAGAAALLTCNIRDFPARRLARFGVTARHPDAFLWELLSREPEVMRGILDRFVVFAEQEGTGGRRLLKRAGLPRLGKAWEAG